MNILVIGNGFDLAHGLPTSYKEFLKFVLESEDMCSRFQKNGLGAKESASAAAEIKEMIKDNFWINHFEKVSECGENWIDFETEISKVIQEIDAVRKLINEARRNPMEENVLFTLRSGSIWKDVRMFSECTLVKMKVPSSGFLS